MENWRKVQKAYVLGSLVELASGQMQRTTISLFSLIKRQFSGITENCINKITFDWEYLFHIAYSGICGSDFN